MPYADRQDRIDIVGLVPAAGRATRVAPLQCSKELFPVGFWSGAGHDGERPKAAAHHLLEKMARAGATKALMVLREGKWDIPAYFRDGELVGMNLAYLVMRRPYGVPFTLDDAYPFLRDSRIVFGFPDILFQPDDAFISLLRKQDETGAQLTLGVFPARRPEKMDMLDLGADGKIRGIHFKPERTSLKYTWLVATWGPAFTEFLHEFVSDATEEVSGAGGSWRGREMYVGDVVWAAIESGLHVETVRFDSGRYVDIGTPEELAAAVREYSSRSTPGTAQ